MTNTQGLRARPEVSRFVAAVAAHLADLPPEDAEELLAGLEADLDEQVAEHGGGVLGDPAAYAAELRAAAGLPPEGRARRRRGLAVRMDALRAGWDDLAERPAMAAVWPVIAALRPVWWVVRAWVAVVLVARLLPGWSTRGLLLVPGVEPFVGYALLGVAVVGSVLVGLGRLWPGAAPAGSRGPLARVLLVLLNAFALVMVPFATEAAQRQSLDSSARILGYDFTDPLRATRGYGVVNRGRQVCNVQAYDAQGRPLVGIQLFDQAGRPMDVADYCARGRVVLLPWLLGDVARRNVFPLAERGPGQEAALPEPAEARVPAVTSPVDLPQRPRR